MTKKINDNDDQDFCFCAGSDESRFEWFDKELNLKLFLLMFSWMFSFISFLFF